MDPTHRGSVRFSFISSFKKKLPVPSQPTFCKVFDRWETNSEIGVGRHSTEVAFALLTQQPRVKFSAFPRVFLKKFIIDVAEIYRQHLECGKLENVDRTI